MKIEYETVFVKHVAAKIAKASELGIKASWSTANHLDALAEAIDRNPGETRQVLQECYNVSAYQQTLAKKFESKGHFQRETAKSAKVQVDDLLSKLLAETV